MYMYVERRFLTFTLNVYVDGDKVARKVYCVCTCR